MRVSCICISLWLRAMWFSRPELHSTATAFNVESQLCWRSIEKWFLYSRCCIRMKLKKRFWGIFSLSLSWNWSSLAFGWHSAYNDHHDLVDNGADDFSCNLPKPKTSKRKVGRMYAMCIWHSCSTDAMNKKRIHYTVIQPELSESSKQIWTHNLCRHMDRIRKGNERNNAVCKKFIRDWTWAKLIATQKQANEHELDRRRRIW